MSQSINQKFTLAEELIDQLKYKEAFNIFKDIALNSKNSNIDRADAYAGMGELIECCDPSLAVDDDESGLIYYKASLSLQHDNLHGLLGVVGSFGESFPNHQDILSFKSAYGQLINRKSELAPYFLGNLEEKYALMQKMEAKNGSKK